MTLLRRCPQRRDGFGRARGDSRKGREVTNEGFFLNDLENFFFFEVHSAA